MNTEILDSPREVRDGVVAFLRRELVGPDPREPYLQPDGEEILAGDPPLVRYSAGVLFPQNSGVETPLFDDAEDAPEELAEPGEAAPEITTNRAAATGAGSSEEDRDGLSDETVSLANAFRPAAMGFSCLAEIPAAGLRVEARAATYRKEARRETGKSGREYSRNFWLREPFVTVIEIARAELLGDEVRNLSRDAGRETAPTKLQLRVLSRPVPDFPTRRLLTVSLVNTQWSAETTCNEECFFQVEMALHGGDDGAIFLEYPDAALHRDEEDCSMALLYRHRKTYGIGHGCAAFWTESDTENGRATTVFCDVLPQHEIKPIVPRLLETPLRMLDFSDLGDENTLHSLLARLCDAYESWLDEQASTRAALALSPALAQAAKRHEEQCRLCLARMRDGAQLLQSDSTVLRAFRLANRAMLQQQLHYALGTDAAARRDWQLVEGQFSIAPPQWPDLRNPPARKGTWYPFQLAFLLMNLRSLHDESDAARGIVDLIWFPTGGGKTEAYLGLTAFAIVLRRLRHPQDGGTCALMRYTLRLLTAQQFQRAASLVCALEKMRRGGDLGEDAAPISIGLWAGGALTPNARKDACEKLGEMSDGEVGSNPFVVLNCPWCGARMGPVTVENRARVLGYEKERTASGATVIYRCADERCDFGGAHSLPLTVIDEDLYDAPPTILLGTVDKFAMLAWKPQARAFFGLAHDYLPPDLIIQDELHLISGPLGSMVGHYETAIHELCCRTDKDGQVLKPKIVASTATIARAAQQCHSLWNCGAENVFQFPPQLLRAGDSFFAQEDATRDGRLYLGIHAAALGSHVAAQVRTMAALLQAPLSLEVREENARDPYWTLIGYYNTLRELGHAATLLNTDISEYLSAMWLRHGLRKPADASTRERRRYINRDLELTSRIPSGKIPAALQQLFTAYPAGENQERPVDVALATNMISVGVDVPRLGVMTVAGQPKTTAEYIQATSRVGRDKPGLVVAIYHTGRARDRSHYEHFHSYHGAIYRAVEPTSVTPFSSPVRERALHALLIILARCLGSEANREAPSPAPDAATRERLEAIVEARVKGVDDDEWPQTQRQMRDYFERWQSIQPPRYGDFAQPDITVPLMYPAGTMPLPEWDKRAKATPSSMRDVDATCEAVAIYQYPRPQDAD